MTEYFVSSKKLSSSGAAEKAHTQTQPKPMLAIAQCSRHVEGGPHVAYTHTHSDKTTQGKRYLL